MKKIYLAFLATFFIVFLAGASCAKNAQIPSGDSPKTNNQELSVPNKTQGQANGASADLAFGGDPGVSLQLENGLLSINQSVLNDGQAHFYNTRSANGQIIYFFVIRDSQGIYRAAANACQVCFGERKGFRQEGNLIVCNNCGNQYPIEKIATEKGGCNPGPISPNLETQGDNVLIRQADLEKVAELF